jgi:hypothetical protein
LVVDIENIDFLRIKFKNKVRTANEFFRQNALKDPINFWEILEEKNMFNILMSYDLYSKIGSLDKYYKNALKIKSYKLYEKLNNINSVDDIMYTRELQGYNVKIDPSYYQKYINM